MNQAEIKRRQAEAFSTILTLITLAVIARVTGENGVAYLAAALEMTGLLWILLSGVVSDTLGRLLRVRNTKGQYKNALKMRRSVFLLQLFSGLAGSAALLIFADKLSEVLFRMQYSTFILIVLSPVIFLRSVSDVLLGFFQGEGTELPTAASAIMRQIFILGFGLLFGKMLGNYGDKVSRLLLQENFTSMYGGVGIAIAISLAEVFIVLFLLLIYKGTKRPKAKLQDDGMKFTDSFFDSIRIFCLSRGAQLGILFLTFLPMPLGLLFLQKSVENLDEAAWEYGAYLSGYIVICGIITAIIYMITLPMPGRVFVHLRKEEQRYAKAVFQSGAHICVVHGFFATFAVTVLASQAAGFISPGQHEAVSKMLVGGASIILFSVLELYFGKTLILTGKKLYVLGALTLSDAVFAASAAIFMNTGKMGADALVYGGIITAGMICVLLGILAYRQLRCRIDWLQVLVIPAGAACVSGLMIMLLSKLLTPHVGNLITIIVTLTAGGTLYWILLLILRNFKEHETEVIPGGRIINAIGQMLHVL